MASEQAGTTDAAPATDPALDQEEAEFQQGVAAWAKENAEDGGDAGPEPEPEPAADPAAEAEDAPPSKDEAGESDGDGTSATERSEQEGRVSPPESETAAEEEAVDAASAFRAEFEQTRKELTALSESMAELKRDNHALKSELGRSRKAASEKSDPPEKQPDTEADAAFEDHFKAFEEFDPDTARALRERQDRLQQQLAEAREQGTSKAEAAAAAANAAAVVENKHPGWYGTIKGTEFLGWLERQPAYVKGVLDSTENPHDVIEIMDSFTAARSRSEDGKSPGAKTQTTASKRKEVRASSAITAPSTSAADPSGSRNERRGEPESSFDPEFLKGSAAYWKAHKENSGGRETR